MSCPKFSHSDGNKNICTVADGRVFVPNATIMANYCTAHSWPDCPLHTISEDLPPRLQSTPKYASLSTKA